MTNPKRNQSGTDSVSGDKSFGVPLQYKGREHVWHKKVAKFAAGGGVYNTNPDMSDGGEILQAPAYARGGEVRMGAGGFLAKAMKGAQKVLPAVESEANKAKFLEPSVEKRRMYHGTGEDVNQFRAGRHGVFVSPESEFANEYARSKGANVMPVRVQVKNPFDYENAAHVEGLRELSKKRFPGNRIISDQLDEINKMDNWSSVEHPDIQKLIQQAGHDSFYANEYGVKNLGIYDPKRIKSDIGNRGTYDINEPDLNKAKGGAVHMADSGAAFGVFPQMKGKRSKQDREASKNVPVDLARGFTAGALGAPGDIESLIRMPYDYLRAPTMSELVTGDKTSKTFFPTSEEVEQRLPFRSESPVSKAASGLGSLAGGFYTGPGAPIRLAGALPGAVKRAGQDFAQSISPVNVIKPKGGNFYKTPPNGASIEGSIQRLRPYQSQEHILPHAREGYDQAARQAASDPSGRALQYQKQQLDEAIKRDALNKWVENNLQNYVKKQMGTMDDPVRALHEEGITHMPRDVREGLDVVEMDTKQRRLDAGFPAKGVAKSDLAKEWENLADQNLWSSKAGDVQHAQTVMPQLQKADRALKDHEDMLTMKFRNFINNNDKLSPTDRKAMLERMPKKDQAAVMGDDQWLKLQNERDRLMNMLNREDYGVGQMNPWVSKLPPETDLHQGVASGMGFDHVIDILKQEVDAGRIRPDQLNKVSISDAVRRTYEFDQEAARKMAEAQIKNTEGMPVYKEYPEGYKWIELAKSDKLPEGYTVDKHGNAIGPDGNYAQHPGEKMLEDALQYEGDTMGHCVGGYCPDVLEGKSRIFSLRNAKGEPHVTIETSPAQGRSDPNAMQTIYDQAHQEANQANFGTTSEFNNFYHNRVKDLQMEMLDKQRAELPHRIVQIKGKQNAAPKEDYLPYVQDFVKSGQWSDVGDLGNTNLILLQPDSELAQRIQRAGESAPRYLTQEELTEYAKKYNDNYAKGGEVHMAGGGAALKAALAKLGKFATEADVAAVKEAGRVAHEQEAFIRAAKSADVEKRLQAMPPRSKAANIEMGLYHPVGGGAKLTKPFEAMHSTRVPNPTVQMPEAKILTPEDLYKERAAFYPLVGDKADTGTFLTHIGEKELEVPVGLGGGPRYMDANYHPEDPTRSAAWESGTGRVTSLGNQAQRAGESGNPVYGVYTAGSGTNTDFNVMGTNAVLQQMPQSKFTKKTEKAFDSEMRSIYPEWPGVRNEAAVDLLMDKGQGELRKSFLTLMGSEPYQKAGLPDIPATRKAIMDPQLYDVPTNESGFRIARMDPTGRIVEDPLHPSDYPTAMAGELAGQLDQGVDYKDMFSSHFNARRAYSQPESGDYYSFSRAHPIQHANQEWLDKIKKAQEAKDKLIKTGKYAKGGLAAAKRKATTE